MEKTQSFAQTWASSKLKDVLRLAIEINQETEFGVDFWLTAVGESIEVRVFKTKEVGSEQLFNEDIRFNSDYEEAVGRTWAVLLYVLKTRHFPSQSLMQDLMNE